MELTRPQARHTIEGTGRNLSASPDLMEVDSNVDAVVRTRRLVMQFDYTNTHAGWLQDSVGLLGTSANTAVVPSQDRTSQFFDVQAGLVYRLYSNRLPHNHIRWFGWNDEGELLQASGTGFTQATADGRPEVHFTLTGANNSWDFTPIAGVTRARLFVGVTNTVGNGFVFDRDIIRIYEMPNEPLHRRSLMTAVKTFPFNFTRNSMGWANDAPVAPHQPRFMAGGILVERAHTNYINHWNINHDNVRIGETFIPNNSPVWSVTRLGENHWRTFLRSTHATSGVFMGGQGFMPSLTFEGNRLMSIEAIRQHLAEGSSANVLARPEPWGLAGDITLAGGGLGFGNNRNPVTRITSGTGTQRSQPTNMLSWNAMVFGAGSSFEFKNPQIYGEGVTTVSTYQPPQIPRAHEGLTLTNMLHHFDNEGSFELSLTPIGVSMGTISNTLRDLELRLAPSIGNAGTHLFITRNVNTLNQVHFQSGVNGATQGFPATGVQNLPWGQGTHLTHVVTWKDGLATLTTNGVEIATMPFNFIVNHVAIGSHVTGSSSTGNAIYHNFVIRNRFGRVTYDLARGGDVSETVEGNILPNTFSNWSSYGSITNLRQLDSSITFDYYNEEELLVENPTITMGGENTVTLLEDGTVRLLNAQSGWTAFGVGNLPTTPNERFRYIRHSFEARSLSAFAFNANVNNTETIARRYLHSTPSETEFMPVEGHALVMSLPSFQAYWANGTWQGVVGRESYIRNYRIHRLDNFISTIPIRRNLSGRRVRISLPNFTTPEGTSNCQLNLYYTNTAGATWGGNGGGTGTHGLSLVSSLRNTLTGNNEFEFTVPVNTTNFMLAIEVMTGSAEGRYRFGNPTLEIIE